LPVEPGTGDNGELAAVGLAVGAAMAYGQVGSIRGYVADAVEVVHAILVGDVRLAAQEVEHRAVELLQLALGGHRHTALGGVGVLGIEEAAVADHDGRDARVGAVVERLQAAAGHTGSTEVAGVDLVIIR